MGESLTQILRADQVRENLIGKHARQCSDDDDADKIDQHEVANLRGEWRVAAGEYVLLVE